MYSIKEIYERTKRSNHNFSEVERDFTAKHNIKCGKLYLLVVVILIMSIRRKFTAYFLCTQVI